MCVDYRKLNSKTVRDSFPLPRIEDALDSLAGSTLFSTMDLASGYHQVPVHETDKHKTAFTTPFGLFEYNRLPFGLVNAPACFQRLMQHCFSEQVFDILLVYIDDIIVYSKSFDQHLDRLEIVFQKLREFGLKLKPSKCLFVKRKVQYLGHTITADGISTESDKVSTVVNWKEPQTVKELRTFLGFASYYRKFISGFARIAGPLHELVNTCKQDTKVSKLVQSKFLSQWTKECRLSFDTLKQKLTTAPILGFPDYTLPFILEVDASFEGLGAVLSQLQNNRKKVIAYASRRLRKPEKNMENYSSMKLELLALKWAITEKFRSYLMGSTFTVYTDNNPLVYLKSAKLGAVEQRWAAQLGLFNFAPVVAIRMQMGCHDVHLMMPRYCSVTRFVLVPQFYLEVLQKLSFQQITLMLVFAWLVCLPCPSTVQVSWQNYRRLMQLLVDFCTTGIKR